MTVLFMGSLLIPSDNGPHKQLKNKGYFGIEGRGG